LVSVLEENMGVLNVTLTDDEAAQLDRTLPAGAAAGDRYDGGRDEDLNL
jgi:aryl-alcohol dehydrogenase-like predicted oxidoreductase